ncbi:superoxide dismutase family protein [Actinoplanes sp. NPDC023714]|uniref:superoxide dismutase family protein n=1 Tax=Actinoplanes sp. NPDC023714 TaxID=3154322 RepID=UPI0033DF9D2C
MNRAIALIAAPLLLGACSSAQATGRTVTPAPTTATTPAGLVPGAVTAGTFREWREGATAVTYDTAAVPAGATAEVAVAEAAGGVTVTVELRGLVPGRAYGAHLHNNPCTADPAAAGPHYQNRVDPAAGPGKPSVDPAYANPENEVWLDFTADAAGRGSARSVQGWRFSTERPPWSFVLHAENTHTGHGEAGTAGARLACLTRKPVPAYVNQPGRA